MWRKTTVAKLSSPAATEAGQTTAQRPAQTPAQTPNEMPEVEESRLAAAAVALEKQHELEREKTVSAEAAVEAAPDEATRPVAAPLTMANADVMAATAAIASGRVDVRAVETSRSPSHVSSGIRIRGEISGNTDLYIDGEVQGNLCFGQAMVTVGPSGRVKADIEAREIVVLGSVQGTLRAQERVQLGGQSRVRGDLLTPRIAIEDGAALSGKIDMTRTNGVRDNAETGERAELSKGDAMRAAV